MRAKWLIAIRRDKFTPSKYSRVCKKHFTQDDYELPKESILINPRPMLKADAVPSIFEWTRNPFDAAKDRRDRALTRRRFGTQPDGSAGHNLNDSDDVSAADFGEESFCIENLVDTALNDEPACVEIESATEDVGVQCCLIGTDNVESDITEVKGASPSDVSRDEQIGRGSTRSVVLCSSQSRALLRLESIKDNPVMIQFYTGFDNYDHFMFVFNLFGEETYNLKYYPSMAPANHHRVLRPPDEFLMTLMKLRCNESNTPVAFLFGVSKSLVSNVFITWVNFLYCRFKDLNILAPQTVIEQNLRFRGKNCSCTLILDCTEIKITKPKNPEAQQLTYSTYKSANTLKVLIGISPSGTVTFISDAFGGSTSGREIIERSGLKDILQDGDTILCDRGFNVQDLVAHKNVTVNMPEFMPKDGSQFTASQLRKSKKISSNRTHVERIIGLAKTYKILNSKLTSTLVALGSRIIFVCFMLTNFRSNIVL